MVSGACPSEGSWFCSSLRYTDILFMFLSCFISIECVSTEYSQAFVICEVSGNNISGVAISHIALVASL